MVFLSHCSHSTGILCCCLQALGERTFHALYSICNGATIAERKAHSLDTPDRYRFLAQGDLLKVPQMNDDEEYKALGFCLRNLGFSEAKCNELLAIVSAVLAIGNVGFERVEDDRIVINGADEVDFAADMLGIPRADLRSSLLSTDGGATPVADPDSMRDLLARELYHRLVLGILNHINEQLDPGRVSSEVTARLPGGRPLTTSLVDFPGFVFQNYASADQTCGLDDLVTNFLHETVYGFYTAQVFKAEELLHRKEGVPFQQVPYFDNSVSGIDRGIKEQASCSRL